MSFILESSWCVSEQNFSSCLVYQNLCFLAWDAWQSWGEMREKRSEILLKIASNEVQPSKLPTMTCWKWLPLFALLILELELETKILTRTERDQRRERRLFSWRRRFKEICLGAEKIMNVGVKLLVPNVTYLVFWFLLCLISPAERCWVRDVLTPTH